MSFFKSQKLQSHIEAVFERLYRGRYEAESKKGESILYGGPFPEGADTLTESTGHSPYRQFHRLETVIGRRSSVCAEYYTGLIQKGFI